MNYVDKQNSSINLSVYQFKYLLKQALLNYKGDDASIVCTKPHRVAAISVAKRVAQEVGEKRQRIGACYFVSCSNASSSNNSSKDKADLYTGA